MGNLTRAVSALWHGSLRIARAKHALQIRFAFVDSRGCAIDPPAPLLAPERSLAKALKRGNPSRWRSQGRSRPGHFSNGRSRATPRLVPANLGIKVEPDQIASFGSVILAYQYSAPWADPQSVSRWQFSAVIPATSSNQYRSTTQNKVLFLSPKPNGNKSGAESSSHLG